MHNDNDSWRDDSSRDCSWRDDRPRPPRRRVHVPTLSDAEAETAFRNMPMWDPTTVPMPTRDMEAEPTASDEGNHDRDDYPECTDGGYER